MNRLAIFLFSLILQYPDDVVSFTPFAAAAPSWPSSRRKSATRTEASPLFGTMLKSIVKQRAGQKRNRSSSSGSNRSASASAKVPVISLELLAGVTREAIYRQDRILEALKKQEDKNNKHMDESNMQQQTNKSVYKRRKDTLNKLANLQLVEKQIHDMQLSATTARTATATKSREVGLVPLQTIKSNLIDLGLQSLLTQGPDCWRHVRDLCRNTKVEFGHPADFAGLVFSSPHGVPILVGRKGAHSDDVLRRISQGSDLWFQVEDYNGSCVLLRSSLVRGLKDSRACRQM